jgi:hypothetical protein
MSSKNDLVSRFLNARALIDSQPPTKNESKKDVRNVVEKSAMAPASSYKHIVDSKPPKKVVIEFLKEQVAKLIDEDSSDDDY